MEDWTGRPCPKCGYARTPLDVNPPWQCPKCGIAYAKYGAPPPNLQALVALHGGGMARRAHKDTSLFWLVAANAAAVALALWLRMSLRDLMLVYWIQSMAIGFTHVFRILALQRFTTGGVYLEGRAAQETLGAKIRVAGLFWTHYGLFHVVYFLFIVFLDYGGPLGSPGTYLVCAFAFLVNHAFSLRHNLERDAAGRPSIGLLMLMPYARIVPMQLVIVSGAYFSGGSSFALLAFGVLKMLADAAMHVTEHYIYERGVEDA